MKKLLFIAIFFLVVNFVFAQLSPGPVTTTTKPSGYPLEPPEDAKPMPFPGVIVTPPIPLSMLPDKDRSDDFIIQLNNLKITKILSHPAGIENAKAIFFAVRDTGWRCRFFKSEEDMRSQACPLNIKRQILRTELVIQISNDTILLQRNRQKADLEDFQVGDKINVYGFMDKDNYSIDALIVRQIIGLPKQPKLPPGAIEGQPPQLRPNIIVIMTDDQDATSISYMEKLKNLLQKRGVTFKNSFVEFPVCCPSRASFLTGQVAHNHTILGNLPETGGGYAKFKQTEYNSLPVWLQGAGYKTALIGKYLNGYGKEVDPKHVPPGWDYWRGLVDNSTYQYYGYTINKNGTLVTYGTSTSDYQTDVLTNEAISFIESQRNSDQPLFMWITPMAPHAAVKSFSESNPEPAIRHKGVFSNLSLPRPPSFNEEDMSDKPQFMQQHPLLSEADISFLTKHYRDRMETLLAVDDMVERIVNKLSELGKLENTVIIYTSDNGYFHGEHRRKGNKYLVYEESIRVPLIITGPGFPENVVRNELVNNLDVVATIVDLARVVPGRVLDGKSLLPLLKSNYTPWRTGMLIEGSDQDGTNPRKFHGSYWAIRTNSYVYVEHENGEKEFYDLKNDPYQLTSKHNDPTYYNVMNFLKEKLQALKSCKGDSCWIEDKIPE
jgi:arylsulfatase A-like enzyme